MSQNKRNFHRRQLKKSSKIKKKDHLREARDSIPYSTQPLLSVSVFDIRNRAELYGLQSA